MVERVDFVVVGGGAMGLSTAWWLAERARVVVLERFEAGHRRGASHGDERIFRYVYRDAAYVELAVAADEGWRRLESAAGKQLLHRVGCVEHGSASGFEDLIRVADRFGVPTEQLTAAEATERWPLMRFAGDVLVQPDAGWLRAADTLSSLTALATAAGAEMRFATQVSAIEPHSDHVRINTCNGQFDAEVVVVTAGAWTAGMLSDVTLPPLVTTEEHVFFFPLAPSGVAGGVPSFLHDGDPYRYGLPGPSGLVKIGEDHTGSITTGDDRTFEADPRRIERMEQYVARWLPGLTPRIANTTTCLYTSTPSRDFIIDRLGPIVLGAGFSGHGFKFVPEIGRRLAALARSDTPSAPTRFALSSQ